MSTVSIPFEKMHGAGNDFIMLAEADLSGVDMGRNVIAQLCDRRTGIGADGLIIVARPTSPDTHFRMIYFNSDGGEAEMCGNGARCTVDFAHRRGLFSRCCLFDTHAGVLSGEILDGGLVEVSLPSWKDLACDLQIQGSPWTEQHRCHTGVPHLVIPVPDVETVDLAKWGPFFRYHEDFAPAGTNVNWVSPDPVSGGLLIRTYERGVEAETLACGTGASASAVVMCQLQQAQSPVSLQTRSGDVLTVSVDFESCGLKLRGPAVTSFKGEVEING